MSKLIVEGGYALSGEITISGNKNALLPMICGSLLTDDVVKLSNVPPISDSIKLVHCVTAVGTQVTQDNDAHTLGLSHRDTRWNPENINLPTGIRSAVLLMAPLLHRTGVFHLEHNSKGCALGIRELDPHLKVVQSFGCKVVYDGSQCLVTAPTRLHSCNIWLDYQSVTATETFLLMAVLAPGISKLTNAASEPHVKYFCDYLVTMGAKIDGIGTSILTVQGVEQLNGTHFRVPDDHHEAATFAAIGAATGGVLRITTDIVDDMPLIIRQFQKIGLNIHAEGNQLITGPSTFEVEKSLTPETIAKVEAAPWPYFPADILPQIIGASIQARGEVLYWNKVYEGALFWSSELLKFGVRSHLSDPHRLILTGSSQLRPAVVEAPYIIRVVLGLVIAALQIEGTSEIRNADPIARAHPDFIDKLQAIGAKIRWVDE